MRGTYRIIEMENAEKGNANCKLSHIQDLIVRDEYAGSIEDWPYLRHLWWQICPNSRQTPAVLRVNKESRTEGMKYYEKRMLDTKEYTDIEYPKLSSREIFFNPKTDILYFGENSCLSTLRNVFNPRDGTQCIPIYHVALAESVWNEVWNRTEEAYYEGDGYGCCTFLDRFDCVLPALQLLHGIDPAQNPQFDTTRFQYGCLGLKTVYYIVPSKPWAVAQGQMSDQIGLRPAASCGVTPD
jgi:hypothetical protein